MLCFLMLLFCEKHDVVSELMQLYSVARKFFRNYNTQKNDGNQQLHKTYTN